MNDSEKVATTVRKYQGGLLALGAGMVLDNPLISALGLFLLYRRATTVEKEAEVEAVDNSPYTRGEIGYNRGIFVLCVGMVAALVVASYSLPAAAGIVTTTTVLGWWLVRFALRTEDKAVMLRAVAEFRQLSEAKQYGYTVKMAAGATGEKDLCFRVSPLWLPRHFVVSVLPGEGSDGGKLGSGPDIPVRWFPTSKAGKAFAGQNGVWIAQGGPEVLDTAIRGALSATLVVDDLEELQA